MHNTRKTMSLHRVFRYFNDALREGKRISPLLTRLVRSHRRHLRACLTKDTAPFFDIVVSRSSTTWSRYSRYNQWGKCRINGRFVQRMEEMHNRFLKALQKLRRVRVSPAGFQEAFIGIELFPYRKGIVLKEIMLRLDWNDSSITLARYFRSKYSLLTVGFWVRLRRPRGKRGKLSQDELEYLEERVYQRTEMEDMLKQYLISPIRLWKVEHYPEEGPGVYRIELHVGVDDGLWRCTWDDLVGFASMLL